MDAYERGIVYTIGLLGGVIGPVLMGNYASRVGYIRTSAISALLASLLTYILTSHSVGAASIVVALHLFALMFLSFSLPTLMQSYMASITSGYNRDLAVGIYFTMSSIFSSLWVWIIGQLIDIYSSFKPVLIFMGSLGLISSTILISQFKKKI
jgi:MFS family permease